MRHSIRSNTPERPRTTQRSPRSTNGSQPADGQERPERALAAGILLPDTTADLRNPLGELIALAEAASVAVVDSMIQKRTELTAAHGLGKGKLAELAQRVEDADVDVVIFDNDLSPRQIRGLEKAVGRRVIDRSELILDIFASRARTREAQLQVELAQLEYTAPRLRGMWTHLERIAGAAGATTAGVVGGVGTRGPGERQIEIDRRIVQKRISHLKREIEDIDARKQRQVHSRGDQFTVSLVGYTNSGKSTLMNKLTRADRFVDDMLFATLDTKTVRWDLGNGLTALLSDTVGFVRNLPHHLVASFRATLEEAIHADLLIHVVDSAASSAFQQIAAVDEVLAGLGCDQVDQITLFNKIDAADDAAMVELIARHRSHALQVSAITGEGLEALTEAVVERVKGITAEATVRIPHRNGKLIAEIDRLADVQARRYLTDAVELDIRMNRAQLGQLRGRHADMVIVKGDSVRAPDTPDDGPL